MPEYEVLVQRIYLVRTREEATFWIDASSPARAREQVEEMSSLYRRESGTTWEILKEKETIKAVHVCRVKRQPADRPQPLPFSRRVRMALGLG